MTNDTNTSTGQQRRRRRTRLAPAVGGIAAGVGAGAAVLAYSLKVEPLLLELTRPVIPLKRLPTALHGLSVLLLTDPHVTAYGTREERLVRLLQEVRASETPDLIVWAGDLIQEGQTKPALRLVREVGCLFPDVPAFVIPGNAEHKLRWRRRAVFLAELAAAGLMPLLNRSVPFTARGETITVAGVDDPYYGHADLEAALDGADVAGRFTLLLAHSPQIATQAARAGVDLMLSGHTHGGQVRLPLLGPLKTQNPLARRMDHGLWDRPRLTSVLGFDPGGDLVTYISRGIGVAPLPRFRTFAPRLFCRPEVALLRLERAERAE